MLTTQQELVNKMIDLIPQQGVISSSAKGVSLVRSDTPTERAAILYHPVFYIVIQGQKTSYLGSEVYLYDPMNFLAISVPLPMEGHVTKASSDAPYLAIKIEINAAMVRELMLELPELDAPLQTSRGVCICPMSDDLSQVVSRLLNCLDDKQKSKILAPLLIKEALFFALLGPQGAQLSAFATKERQHQRIAKVIRHIQNHFASSLELAELADIATMSKSSLHQHFKAVTSTSPLQYIKAVRLHQAHQLITLEQHNISEAAYQVGYQSLSQFSREYRRFFGHAPSSAPNR